MKVLNNQEEQLRYLLALLRIPGLGPVKLSDILDECSDLTALFDAMDNCRVMPGKAKWAEVDQDLQWALQPGCHILTQSHQAFPTLLKEVRGAPLVLFVRGNVKCLTRPQIAMVGSRHPTPIGRETAFEFARHFATVGFTITSGLAIGIDASSHKGALAGTGSGSTIAVLGNGLDKVYPPSHQALAHEIAEKGALVSEFPIGTPPLTAHFPRRNRVISGLSMGTLVVEAAVKSGSLITAKCALDQGREVFAIPGSIHSSLAKGCHALIRQGAKLVETAEDVLEELGALVKYVSQKKVAEQLSLRSDLHSLEPDHEALLNHVNYQCTSVDTVVELSGLKASQVSSILLELELQGFVTTVPGGYARLLA